MKESEPSDCMASSGCLKRGCPEVGDPSDTPPQDTSTLLFLALRSPFLFFISSSTPGNTPSRWKLDRILPGTSGMGHSVAKSWVVKDSRVVYSSDNLFLKIEAHVALSLELCISVE